mmetsp:Transcript_28070/g.93215  ORF Transcript_28070/g.93215 Transcript_28070/m.93215 type:complete len:264 (-) Transcript_28070:2208-2999(-)
MGCLQRLHPELRQTRRCRWWFQGPRRAPDPGLAPRLALAARRRTARPRLGGGAAAGGAVAVAGVAGGAGRSCGCEQGLALPRRRPRLHRRRRLGGRSRGLRHAPPPGRLHIGARAGLLDTPDLAAPHLRVAAGLREPRARRRRRRSAGAEATRPEVLAEQAGCGRRRQVAGGGAFGGARRLFFVLLGGHALGSGAGFGRNWQGTSLYAVTSPPCRTRSLGGQTGDSGHPASVSGRHYPQGERSTDEKSPSGAARLCPEQRGGR